MTGTDRRLRVLVADDSPVARQLLVHILDSDPALRVAGVAADGDEAVQLAHQVRPEVIVMDVLMPRMDGLAATRQIMTSLPTPIVLVSADADARDLSWSFQALQAGALTLLAKPPGPPNPAHAAAAAALTTTVKLMAEVKVVRRRSQPPTPRPDLEPARRCRAPVEIVAIAASTGGPAALATVLTGLGRTPPPVPVLIVQHIVAGFDRGLASWLDDICPAQVGLARDGQPLRAGEVLLAPCDAHLGVTRAGTVALSTDPPVGAHRPSATHLFGSVAQAYGRGVVGVVLTGMGEDGAVGLRAVKDAGGLVLAQDEPSCVVYGMPRAAADLGAVDRMLPLDQIAAALTSAWTRRQP